MTTGLTSGQRNANRTLSSGFKPLNGGIVITPEPFVSAQEATKFIGISRRFLIELARRGIIGAYPIGTGELRKTWVFRLSELAVLSVGKAMEFSADRRKASERIVQSLGVPY